MQTIKTKLNAATKSNKRVVDISVLRQPYKSYNDILTWRSNERHLETNV